MVDIWEFWQQQGVSGFLRIYWYYFIFELPRYVLFDYIFVGVYYVKNMFSTGEKSKARKKLWSERPLVSIIVPGKNEGENYFQLCETLSEQTYQNFELIVIDDGSDDNSRVVGKKLEEQGRIDKFLHNEQPGGKASAANWGLHESEGKFIIHMDADCSFDRDALEELLIPFYKDEKVGAVGGRLEVRNKEESLATVFQTIEYYFTILVGRVVS